MKLLPFALALPLLAAATGCDRRPDDAPLRVSAIGTDASPADPDRGPLDFPDAVLTGASAQGLVRFDADGQVEPGLAQRWIVIDEGKSYIFRLADARWADGEPVDARQVARALGRALSRGSDNPLAPFLHAVQGVVAMTPQVVEIDLKTARPDFLRLLAQPEMAIFRTRPISGTGPFRFAKAHRGVTLTSVRSDEDRDDGDESDPRQRDHVVLTGERASLALLRYRANLSDLILGGTFDDWPLVGASEVPTSQVEIDPAAGLFGFRVTGRDGFLATAAGREAIAMAIDRQAALGRIMDGWSASETILPDQLDSARPPASSAWSAMSQEARIDAARRRVAAWRTSHRGPIQPIRVALPKGPGANLLWTGIGPALHAIGLPVMRVAMNARADLRLVDAVAPFDGASWYLRTACGACGDPIESLIDAARDAADEPTRAQRLADADVALAADGDYIPLARPLRWSLVNPGLAGFTRNPRAWHPLNHLRNESGS